MSREQNVPLLLWICTAMMAHIASGGGADQVARVLEDRSELRSFARAIRGRLQPAANMEVTLESIPAAPEPPPPPDAAHITAQPKPKKEANKTEPAKTKPPEKRAVQPITLPKMAAATPPPPPPPAADHRIAVKQNAVPDQEDNPTAHFIADDANRVDEESVARITAHDQDDPNPTPGGHHSGPAGVGNGERERVADSDEHRGDPTRAPGETANKADSEHKQLAAPPAPGDPSKSNAPRGETASSKPAYARGPELTAPPAPTSPPAGGATAAAETIASDNGTYRVDPTRPGGPGAQSSGVPGPGRLPPPAAPSSPIGMLGLGGAPTAGGVNLNLTVTSVVAVVGQDKLDRERLADGERRRSAHRGSWQSSGFERWRAAMENYVSSVKTGNQTALNAARSPFGTYIVTIHNRIHPIFADDFLGSLDGLPTNHPLNDATLITRLEIVLDRDDGHVVKMGVVRTSGMTAFDVAALDSVQRASPFGKPPKAIVSPDGNVYLHWEFHRDPVLACSTMNASPFIVNTPPATPTPAPATPKPSFPGIDPREQGPPPPGSRQGWVAPPAPGEQRRPG